MNRQSRHVAGWALALSVALLLELAVVRPTMAPDLGQVAATPTPRPAAVGVGPDPFDTLPHPATRPLPAVGIAGSARPAELAPLPPEQAAALQLAIDSARTRFDLDTLVVGVSVPGGRGWTGASGLARDGVTPLTGDSPFVIASITKTFTAALVLQLVQERRLSLETEVATLLPEVAVPAGVTVEQLLRHTSGIADLLRPLRPRLNNDTEHQFTPSEVVAAVGPVWWPPGADWGYSNTNYVLLGMVIERVTGQPFAQVLERRLLDPLEMDTSGMLGQPEAPWLMPPAWVTAFWTSGSMYATADDLLRWGDALYRGNVLRPSARERMLSFDEHDYGLGAELLAVGDEPAYGHSGLLRGFTTLLVHLPAEGATIVLLSTGDQYDPAVLLASKEPEELSIMDLALDGPLERPDAQSAAASNGGGS
jgi:D-alanyl-D-alanine carboxypeptidase